MKPYLVIDSSIALGWSYDDERGPFALRVFGLVVESGAIVPQHWHLEVTNSLVYHESGGRRIVPEDSRVILGELSQIPLTIDADTSMRAFGDTLALARKHSLTSYDAAYLELTIRRRMRLATLDNHLLQAAVAEGVAFEELAA